MEKGWLMWILPFPLSCPTTSSLQHRCINGKWVYACLCMHYVPLLIYPCILCFVFLPKCEPVCCQVGQPQGQWPQVVVIWQSLLVCPLMLLSEPQHSNLRETDREQTGKMQFRRSCWWDFLIWFTLDRKSFKKSEKTSYVHEKILEQSTRQCIGITEA